MIVYAVVDDTLSPDFPLGDSLEVFVRREDAERFIEEVHVDEPDLAKSPGIEERELEAAGLAVVGYLGRLVGCPAMSRAPFRSLPFRQEQGSVVATRSGSPGWLFGKICVVVHFAALSATARTGIPAVSIYVSPGPMTFG